MAYDEVFGFSVHGNDEFITNGFFDEGTKAPPNTLTGKNVTGGIAVYNTDAYLASELSGTN